MTPGTPLADLVGRPLPDLSLPTPEGRPYALRGRAGVGPLAMFIFIRNGTPG